MKVFICGSVSEKIKQKYLEGIDKIAENLIAHDDGVMLVGAQTGSIGAMYNKMVEGKGRIDIIVPTPYADEAEGMVADSIIKVDTLFLLQQVALRNTSVTIVLPGGNGTLAELYMITDSIKSKFDTDLVIVYNNNGFYDHVKAMNDFMLKAGTLNETQYKYFTWCDTCEEVIAELDSVRASLKENK